MESIRTLQSAASPALDGLALTITNIGHEMTYIALLVIAYLVFDPSRGRRLGIYFLAAFYLNQVLKGIFETPRPYLIDPEVLRSSSAEATVSGDGFPSGHAQGAATFWGIAALYLRRPWFTALALLLIGLIALSRVYLGVHLPIDVIVGLALGAATVALVPLMDRIEVPSGRVVQVVLGISAPLLLHLLVPTSESALLLGGLAGFLTAPLVYGFERPTTVLGRSLAGLLGLILVFAALMGSSMLLPEEVKRQALVAFLRYLGLAYVGLVLAPLVYDFVARRSSV